MRSSRRTVILLGLSCLVHSLGGSTSADGDPLEWRPPAKPVEFRRMMTDGEFQRRAAPFLNRLPKARNEAAGKLPDHGLQLSGVMVLGPLGAHGVTEQDIIAKVDGKDLWGRWTASRSAPVRLQIFSPRRNGLREIEAETDLDHRFSVHRRPDLAYLRGTRRNVAWDRDAFVGVAAAASAPDLAETAWHRAAAAGSPRNRLCLMAGATLALAQGRPEAAADFWYEAEHVAGSEPLDPLLAYQVMIANFKLEQARDLARKYPELFPKMAAGLGSLIASHRARPLQDQVAPRPSIRAKSMHRRDARGNLVGNSQAAENQFLDLLTRRGVYHASASSNHFSLVELGLETGLANFDLGLTLAMTASDAQRAEFVKLVRLILAGTRKTGEGENAEPSPIVHAELEIPSGFSLASFEAFDPIYLPDPLIAVDGKTRNSIRIVRVGEQMEVFINERRVLYQPILPETRLRSIHFQAVGTTIEVTGFILDELIPRL